MSFILVMYAVLLIALTMLTYRRIISVILVIVFLMSVISVLLYYGLSVFETQELWHIFGKDIDRPTFLLLLAVLLAFNSIASFFIARSYREYRRVNRR